MNRNITSKEYYVTVCDSETTMAQSPIVYATLAMIAIFALSSGLIYVLHRMLDPIKLMQMSRCCFPARCFDSIWPEDQKPLLGPILHFILNPCKQTFDETNKRLVEKSGHDLIYWSIKNNYLDVIRTIVEPNISMEITSQIIKATIFQGEATAMKIILSKAGDQQNIDGIETANIPIVLKMLSDERSKIIVKSCNSIP